MTDLIFGMVFVALLGTALWFYVRLAVQSAKMIALILGFLGAIGLVVGIAQATDWPVVAESPVAWIIAVAAFAFWCWLPFHLRQR